ncbi:MAG: hypothetical protein DWQ58_25515 [Microcystis aeruginosa TA09]|nr:MAG: hypothetical protein DWQ58_25515 [Microcystis aeruginosa TA09]
MTQGNPTIPLKLTENSIRQNRLTTEVMQETQIEFVRSYIDAGECGLTLLNRLFWFLCGN